MLNYFKLLEKKSKSLGKFADPSDAVSYFMHDIWIIMTLRGLKLHNNNRISHKSYITIHIPDETTDRRYVFEVFVMFR